jgi:hypothetical protein
MRRTLCLLSVGTALLAACAVDPAPTSSQEESEINTSPAPAGLPPVLCGAHDGQACSPAGSHFQCFNKFPLEPGVCFCQSDLTLTCG